MRTTYFNSLLLPVAVTLRALARFNHRATESSLDLWVPPAPMNWLLEQPLRLEAELIDRGVQIPRRVLPCCAEAQRAPREEAVARDRQRRGPRQPAAAWAARAAARRRAPERVRAYGRLRRSRKVQARLARKVRTTTISVAKACPSELVEVGTAHEQVDEGEVQQQPRALDDAASAAA